MISGLVSLKLHAPSLYLSKYYLLLNILIVVETNSIVRPKAYIHYIKLLVHVRMKILKEDIMIYIGNMII